MLVCLAAAGCKENSSAPAPLPIAQAPQAIETAFKDATPALKKKSADAVAALNAKETDKAFFLLQELANQPGLTTKQREASAASMLAARAELQAAADKGDTHASALVQYRRMSK
jgi:hypothetical protein